MVLRSLRVSELSGVKVAVCGVKRCILRRDDWRFGPFWPKLWPFWPFGRFWLSFSLCWSPWTTNSVGSGVYVFGVGSMNATFIIVPVEMEKIILWKKLRGAHSKVVQFSPFLPFWPSLEGSIKSVSTQPGFNQYSGLHTDPIIANNVIWDGSRLRDVAISVVMVVRRWGGRRWRLWRE